MTPARRCIEKPHYSAWIYILFTAFTLLRFLTMFAMSICALIAKLGMPDVGRWLYFNAARPTDDWFIKVGRINEVCDEIRGRRA